MFFFIKILKIIYLYKEEKNKQILKILNILIFFFNFCISNLKVFLFNY